MISGQMKGKIPFIPNDSYRACTLEVHTGGVGSEKYKPLVPRFDKIKWLHGVKAEIFGPDVDDKRYTQDGIKLTKEAPFTDDSYEFELPIKKIPADQPEELLSKEYEDIDVFEIVGGQFFSNKLVDVVRELIRRNKNVIIAGVDKDHKGNPYRAMGYLIPKADIVTKYYDECYKSRCKEEATLSEEFIDEYKSVCLKHKDFSFLPEELSKEIKAYQQKAIKENIKLGTLEVYSGNMRSGKSEAVIDRAFKILKKKGYSKEDAKNRIMFLKHTGDRTCLSKTGILFREDEVTTRVRYGDKKISLKAIIMNQNNPRSILENENILEKEVFVFNEAQFWRKDTAYVIDILRLMGKDVIVDGICTDFRGEVFGQGCKELPVINAIAYLQADAKKIIKSFPNCEHEDGCQNRAIMIQRIIDGKIDPFDAEVRDEGEEAYHMRCVPHFIIPDKTPDFLNEVERQNMNKWDFVNLITSF